MSFWIAGAVVVSTAYNAYEAKQARDKAERDQKLALQKLVIVRNWKKKH